MSNVMDNMDDLVVAAKNDLLSIADAIRTRCGIDDALSFPNGFIDKINGIGGSGDTFETQSKTVTPTETQQTVTPDDNYDGLSSVTVNAIPSSYVGSGVSKQDSKTVTPTKSTQVAVESGVYTIGQITVNPIPSEYIVTSDATAISEDIVSGKTAYVNGVKVTGTHECPEESGGIDTSDATATASDMAEGVTAYVNGEKITGTIRVENDTYSLDNTSYFSENSYFVIYGFANEDVIIKQDTTSVELGVPMSRFGDATADDVVSGKYFTSSNGVKIIGTHVCSSGTDTSDATAVAEDIAAGKTAYVNGEKITGNMVVQSYYISSTEPANNFGIDGDLCLVRGE